MHAPALVRSDLAMTSRAGRNMTLPAPPKGRVAAGDLVSSPFVQGTLRCDDFVLSYEQAAY